MENREYDKYLEYAIDLTKEFMSMNLPEHTYQNSILFQVSQKCHHPQPPNK